MSGMEIKKENGEFLDNREIEHNMKKYQPQLENIREKYNHIRIFSFKNESNTKFILDYINSVGLPIEESEGIPLKDIGFFEHKYRPMTKEDFLNNYGHSNPVIHSLGEIDNMFRDIFFFLERQSNEKIKFIQEFAQGLNKNKGSDSFLLDFVGEVERDKRIKENEKIRKKIEAFKI